jgi:hypothetical protein
VSPAAPYTPHQGVLFLIYWVAYQRGSFSVKERYFCPERARDRCGDLITEARYIRIIPGEENETHLLSHCFELPAAS